MGVASAPGSLFRRHRPVGLRRTGGPTVGPVLASLGAALALSVAGAVFAAAERQDLDPFLTVFAFAALAAVLGVLAAARTSAQAGGI